MPELDLGERWRVTLNGVTVKKMMPRAEADAMAERWQGSHSSYGGSSGLLRIKDRGDHVEVKRDYESEREIEDRIKVWKAGDRQKITIVERTD